jgi:hypothetical protein
MMGGPPLSPVTSGAARRHHSWDATGVAVPKGRLWRAMVARLPTSVHSQAVLAEMSISELARAGIVDTRDRRGLLDRLYQVYRWIVVVLVLVLTPESGQ